LEAVPLEKISVPDAVAGRSQPRARRPEKRNGWEPVARGLLQGRAGTCPETPTTSLLSLYSPRIARCSTR
jgi:hypothetical protein